MTNSRAGAFHRSPTVTQRSDTSSRAGVRVSARHNSGVARIRRGTASRILRTLWCGFSLFNWPRFALAAGALFGAPAFADELNLAGTTITLRPSEVATAEIHMNNVMANGPQHNGAYALKLDGLTVALAFIWDADGGDDRIIVSPPPGYACEPADCTLTIPEGQFGTLYLEWLGM